MSGQAGFIHLSTLGTGPGLARWLGLPAVMTGAVPQSRIPDSCAVCAPPLTVMPPCRSLGVTIWELFELGAQPYPHHSDRQVLAYAVREQQLKLPKPQLQLALSDRW